MPTKNTPNSPTVDPVAESLDTTEERARARLADIHAQLAQIDERQQSVTATLDDLDTRLADAQRAIMTISTERDRLPDELQHARANLLIMSGSAAEAQGVARFEAIQQQQRDLDAQMTTAQDQLAATTASIATERTTLTTQQTEDAAARDALASVVSALEQQIDAIHLARGRQVLDGLRQELAARTHMADESHAVARAAAQDLRDLQATVMPQMSAYPQLIAEARALIPPDLSPTAKVLDAYDALLAVIEEHAGHIRGDISGTPTAHLLAYNGVALNYTLTNSSNAVFVSDIRRQVAQLRTQV